LTIRGAAIGALTQNFNRTRTTTADELASNVLDFVSIFHARQNTA
jgi:hypothetical protein